ncbi:acyl-CoA desaturase [Ferrimonas aestuarii]|uniref:Acyl-CoA desaturase n=1 Tax=Ferrimonas aestuarii TaxID=2569539 RepID=A0A4U1BJV4_9GAMM|nr:acyl-CoA desaturase [Ferrimonas aestuarii]TKB51864.1 acyl-CoA desaturase [Ferrimonas aestuarii]
MSHWKVWLDNESTPLEDPHSRRFNLVRCLPFIMLHVSVIAVFWVPASAFALAIAAVLYVVRAFALTAFYHRYFAHKAFRTHRWVQFVFAFIGASAAQRGPLWWSGHHRQHHAHTDKEGDLHSPKDGFWWSHMLWFTCNASFATPYKQIPEFSRFPELRWLNRFDWVAPLSLIATLFLVGELCAAYLPSLNTDGAQLVVWGFVVSTLALLHATLGVNSLCHRFGSRRYDTDDMSRNNWVVALLTLGEGWHNNHHKYPKSARNGFYWWELDPTFWGLKIMERLGLVWQLAPVPKQAYQTVGDPQSEP